MVTLAERGGVGVGGSGVGPEGVLPEQALARKQAKAAVAKDKVRMISSCRYIKPKPFWGFKYD